MKTNRELIMKELKNNTMDSKQEEIGVTTLHLSKTLGLQRTNISSILNRLVQEGIVEKSDGRPVLYRLSSNASKDGEEHSCFRDLVGYHGSLKNAISLAKAAILYPEQCLHTLVEGESGSGKSQFIKYMYSFALEVKVLQERAPFIKFNCRNYIGDEAAMERDLFSKRGDDFINYIERAQNGVLFLDNIHELAASAKSKLYEFIDSNHIIYDDHSISKEMKVVVICAGDSSADKAIREGYANRFPVKINLPSLGERSLIERFELIQEIFKKEAIRTKKTLKINSELLRCLLLYRCKFNIKQLKHDIQLGCANAFVREFNQNSDELEVYISDMEHYVRKGFLNYKYHREAIESMIPDNYSYSFTEGTIDRQIDESSLNKEGKNIYDAITGKVLELSERGIEQKDINLLLSVEIENSFKHYRKHLTKRVVNKEQLSKIVDYKVMTLVEQFLERACFKFDKDYPASVFYGLCLHLNSAIERIQKAETLSSKQISEVVETHKEEYSFCLQFASKVEEEFHLRLPIDEVIIITMFLCDYDQQREEDRQSVILVAMHGSGAAREIAEVINTLVKSDNVYSYDLNLDKHSEDAYQEMKEKMLEIHRGKGIIVLYDMGSIRKMSEMICEETNLYARYVKIPITLFGLELARKAAMGDNIDSIVDGIQHSFMKSFEEAKEMGQIQKERCIITLCNTGEGGALEMKHYLEQNQSFQGVKVIPLAISDRNQLKKEVIKIKRHNEIVCCIGTFHPESLNLPFVSIANVFENEVTSVEDILALVGSEANNIDYTSIYEYLDDQLEYVEIEKVKKVFPTVLRKIKQLVPSGFGLDQELGLFVHLASSVNRSLSAAKMPTNIKKDAIIKKYETLFKELLKILKPVEKTFGIIISDDEMANIISIIKKI